MLARITGCSLLRVLSGIKQNCYTISMFNVGVGFMACGLMLWLYKKLPMIGAGTRLTTTGRVVGYKQFPTDKTITNNNIFRGQNFTWLRVVSFKNPHTGETLEMYSNPGVANPESIGTEIKIDFNPSKTDPVKNFVWVQNGMRAVGIIANISFITGLVVFVILLFVPKTSPLHFILIVPAFMVVFIASYINIWKRPNQ